MKRIVFSALIAAFLALLAVKPGPLSAQTPAAEFLPMGAYTNDFSAPMPGWWFHGIPSYYFDSETTDPGCRDLSPFVYSNDYALATEGLVHRFAAHATYCLGEMYWLLGNVSFYAPYDYWYYSGALDSLFSGMNGVATREYAAGVAGSLWDMVDSLGGYEAPPWNWDAPGGTEAANIGQLKNAFSFSLDDVDGDYIPDVYEYREFGALDFAEDLFSDPGGDGLCLLAEMHSGLDPLAGPEAFEFPTNNVAEVRLFPSFEAEVMSEGDIVFERTFPIRRAGSWQQYFLARNDMWPETARLDILYSDSTNAYHSIGDVFGPDSTNTVVRLQFVSPDQTNLTVRIVTAQNAYGSYGGYFSCPSLSLVCWSPEVDFPTATRAVVDGKAYFAVVPDGMSRLEIPFTVDWANPPDGSDPTEDWNDGADLAFPLVLSGVMEADLDTNNVARLPSGGTMRPGSAGAYPLAPFGPLPQPPARGANGDETLLVAAPRLTWPSSWRSVCRSWLDYDQVTGTYSNCTAYPLDSQCLQEAWHYESDRYCDHAPEPTLDLGDRGLDQILDYSFTPVSDFPPTSRCTLTIAGSNIWEDVISHYCPSAMRSDCGNGDPDDNCDCDCDCGGSGVDGDSAGSCQFRLALGFPLFDTVSGFLWFRSETIPPPPPCP